MPCDKVPGNWTRLLKETSWMHRLGTVTVKILNFGTPQTIAIIVLKLVKFDVTSNFTNFRTIMAIALMHPKEADAMANSVDPDQTASSEAV